MRKSSGVCAAEPRPARAASRAAQQSSSPASRLAGPEGAASQGEFGLGSCPCCFLVPKRTPVEAWGGEEEILFYFGNRSKGDSGMKHLKQCPRPQPPETSFQDSGAFTGMTLAQQHSPSWSQAWPGDGKGLEEGRQRVGEGGAERRSLPSSALHGQHGRRSSSFSLVHRHDLFLKSVYNIYIYILYIYIFIYIFIWSMYMYCTGLLPPPCSCLVSGSGSSSLRLLLCSLGT